MARREQKALIADLPEFLTKLIKKSIITEDEGKEYLERASGLKADFNMDELVQYSEQHKKDFPKFIYCALHTPKTYQRIVKKNPYDIITLAEIFPRHTEALIAPLLASPEEHQRVVGERSSHLALISLIEAYPHHAEALIAPLLASPEEYQHVVDGSAYILRYLARTLPQYAEVLIATLLTSLEAFQRFVQNDDDLAILASDFPHHADKLNNFEEGMKQLIDNMEEWRPRNHKNKPTPCRDTMRALVMLAKTRQLAITPSVSEQNNAEVTNTTPQTTMLHLEDVRTGHLS